jgi:hypothetical protein
MGLDWNPGSRAKPGCEAEFIELWKKLHAKSCFFRGRKIKRFHEITITAFETLNCPRIGFDESATRWAEEDAFPRRSDKSLNKQTFVQKMKGFYVLSLVPPCDGLPRYTNGSPGGYVEAYAFRGAFLKDCEYILGAALLNSAWVSKLPNDTVAYGNQLLDAANKFALVRKIDVSTVHLNEDPDSEESHIDVVLSAGRWCRFWGERGHWLDAYF